MVSHENCGITSSSGLGNVALKLQHAALLTGLSVISGHELCLLHHSLDPRFRDLTAGVKVNLKVDGKEGEEHNQQPENKI